MRRRRPRPTAADAAARVRPGAQVLAQRPLDLFNLAPNGTIQAMRSNGRDRHTILKARDGFGAHKPSYSPNGTRLLFMCEKQGTLPKPPDDHNEDICISNADGSNIVNLTNTPKIFENWPSWGPRRSDEQAGPRAWRLGHLEMKVCAG
jgi:hypothetical protein